MFQASVAEGLANTLGAIVMQTLKSVDFEACVNLARRDMVLSERGNN